jgi:hypothetical protein
MSHRKLKPPDASEDDYDRWTWAIIAVVYAGVAVALWGPVMWQIVHG